MATPNPSTSKTRPGSIVICVSDIDGGPVARAHVSVYRAPEGTADLSKLEPAQKKRWVPDPARKANANPLVTEKDGCVTLSGLRPAVYVVRFEHLPETEPEWVQVDSGCTVDVCFKIRLGAQIVPSFVTGDCENIPCPFPRVGDRERVSIKLTYINPKDVGLFPVIAPSGALEDPAEPRTFYRTIGTVGPQKSIWKVGLPIRGQLSGISGTPNPALITLENTFAGTDRPAQIVAGNLGVALQRTATAATDDISLWLAIRNSTDALSFNNYFRFMNMLFCGENGLADLPAFERERFVGGKTTKFVNELRPVRLLPFTDADAYRVVKAATEAFVMVNCGISTNPLPFDADRDASYLGLRDLPGAGKGADAVFNEDYLVSILGGEEGKRTLPYLAVIRAKLPDVAIKFTPLEVAPELVSNCFGILQEKLANPCLLELIWSYWHEEGMLVQTMNAITRRFQNVRAPMTAGSACESGDRSAAAAQQPALGLLPGRAAPAERRAAQLRIRPPLRTATGRQGGASTCRPADTRSKFLEAFHNLLHLCTAFFKQDDDTTVKADAFPVLNALKEVHLILSQGAHNQFGDLPSTARIEMLMQQWLLARPEFREFLPTRIMVAYPEPWMDRVDAMKKLQGWTDTSVLHFRNLGVFGEQLLLSIRYGALERRQRSDAGVQLGALLAPADPGLHPRLPCCHRRRSRRRDGRHQSGCNAALGATQEAADRAATQRMTERRDARLHLRALPRFAPSEHSTGRLGCAHARPSFGRARASRRRPLPRTWHACKDARRRRCCLRRYISSGICSECWGARTWQFCATPARIRSHGGQQKALRRWACRPTLFPTTMPTRSLIWRAMLSGRIEDRLSSRTVTVRGAAIPRLSRPTRISRDAATATSSSTIPRHWGSSVSHRIPPVLMVKAVGVHYVGIGRMDRTSSWAAHWRKASEHRSPCWRAATK